MLVDTIGLMLVMIVHGADVQDRDGSPDVLKFARFRFPWLRHVFAPCQRTKTFACRMIDGGYAGEKLHDAMEGQGDWTIEIIRRSDTAKGFEVLPRTLTRFARKPLPGSGWVVERTFAWLSRCRRLAKDWEGQSKAQLRGPI